MIPDRESAGCRFEVAAIDTTNTPNIPDFFLPIRSDHTHTDP